MGAQGARVWFDGCGMTAQPSLMVRIEDATLRPDLSRVIARLFLPGEELTSGHTRAEAVVERVLALPESEVQDIVADLFGVFSLRHRRYEDILQAHAATLSYRVENAEPLTPERRLLLGATFTSEYAVEGAALCNPSAVPAPDQSGLDPGQLRVAVSLRCIGEGHHSSIGFATAIIGPGAQWVFEPRTLPATTGPIEAGLWQRDRLMAVMQDHGTIDELGHRVLAALPTTFTGTELGAVLADFEADVRGRRTGPATADLLRELATSVYQVEFPDDVSLSQQVLMPATAQESNGMEDARFVRFHGEHSSGGQHSSAENDSADSTVEYRAVYTAYDGSHIAPRLLTSPDLKHFASHRLSGRAARDKGMALFPRLIGGRHFALCRSDGECNYVASSADGLHWDTAIGIGAPQQIWQTIQVGNCGPPIETADGWLVLTHGVGPMRVYRIGAMLLDLDEPARVIKVLKAPLLQGEPAERDGYVPNVVYSCGGLAHDRRLWLPYGIGDARIGVAWADLDDVLAAMSPVPD